MPTLYANPTKFMQVSAPLWQALFVLSLVFLGFGLYFAFAAPGDYQQGLTIRILFLHVPSAWMAMMVYGFMATASIAAFIWRTPLADIAAHAAAPIGLVWVALALWSGSLWGKPIWGTFWVWDARLVSVLVLLFLYLGYLALLKAIDEQTRRNRAARLVAIIGALNLPIIKFSVDWWNTLHQPASIMRLQAPALAPVYLLPLGLMAAGALCWTMSLIFVRMRAKIIRHQLETQALERF
jgi:heme exporter protein C